MFDDFDTQICPEEFEDNFIEDEDLYGYNLEDYDYSDGTAIAYGITLLQTILNKKRNK